MKPKILLLHGALGQDSEFLPLMRKLAVHFECTPLTFSGHGDAKSRSHMVDLEVLTLDLVDFFKTNGFDYFVFGYSLGGYVALNYCMHYPKNLPNAIMTYATKLNWTDDIRAKFSARLDPAKIEAKGGAFVQTLQNRFGAKWPQLVRDTERLINHLKPDTLRPEILAPLKIPFHLCVGEQDPIVSLAETEAFAKQLPTGSCTSLKNSGHELEKTDLNELCSHLQKCFSKP